MAQRNDAMRNRRAILRVAEEAFAQDELVPLHEIARRAGLGRATVYRHFPDRQALGVAVAARNLAALRRVVAQPADYSFRDLLHMVLTAQTAMRPLVTLFEQLPARDRQRHLQALIGVLTPPFLRAQAEGQLRPGVTPQDLGLVLQMLDAGVKAEAAGAQRHLTAQRLIAVLLDGLFPGPQPGTHQQQPAYDGSHRVTCRPRPHGSA
jgi:AcrR family transcriptional regulator